MVCYKGSFMFTFYRVDVGSVADVSEARVSSLFKFEVGSVGECWCVCLYTRANFNEVKLFLKS
jgi:hypothetical protein